MLGTAQPNALSAEGARLERVVWRVGVCANIHAAKLVDPPHQCGEVLGQLRLAHGHAAHDNPSGRAVDRNDVALVQLHAACF